MQYLFVDNFRGFTNTFIPIDDVNFFVGENSTGKTSILELLKLMSSPEFCLYVDFNTPEISFGHFKDIVSVYSNDRTYFSIGFVRDFGSTVEGRPQEIQAFLMTFVEDEGKPQPKMFIYYDGNIELRLRLWKKTKKYKYQKIQQIKDAGDLIESVYPAWVDAHRTDTIGYKTLPAKLRSFGNAPLVILLSVLEGFIKEKGEKQRNVRPRFPRFIDEIRFIGEITCLAPIRTKPLRTYDEYKLEFSPEGDHTPYLVKKILDRKSSANSFKRFLKKVGRESGLFESVVTKKYGRDATAPFELDVLINRKALSISSVGYGVSQVLPVIVELFARPKKTWFAIQQPEIHLHPKAQAALGDVIFELAVREQKRFLVETHSDYLIDRYRLRYKGTKHRERPNAQILYFERKSDGNHAYRIEISNEGELPSDQPKGYREFFVKEDFRLLRL